MLNEKSEKAIFNERRNKLQRCIKYQGAKVCNSTPQEIRVLSYKRFKIQYKNFLLNQ